ncbi:uncharacterized protein PHALS_15304 [Plasmopara halstedii]|uniref:Uncharacterized protein n=1 Tax=Plasmopara halstedii TaxID=4781 RepID=A0A0N7L4D6_PLAHL|nr:uncharacterized protein PHALS_15304 [Plasmopara halstedii]CEG38379.1 hypothetical protein PHALS_15304 [Plasmopara halstedii]|eukprot:XP_024574748.1 hypothetical protein PHALS_15304 [Plasmopara halstedii]
MLCLNTTYTQSAIIYGSCQINTKYVNSEFHANCWKTLWAEKCTSKCHVLREQAWIHTWPERVCTKN